MRVQGFGLKVEWVRFRVLGFGFWVESLYRRSASLTWPPPVPACGFGVAVQGFEFDVQASTGFGRMRWA